MKEMMVVGVGDGELDVMDYLNGKLILIIVFFYLSIELIIV